MALALLEAKDRTFHNVTFTIEELTENIRGESREFRRKDRYEVRRLGDKLWMQSIVYPWGKKTEEIQTHSIYSWDGRVARTMGVPPYLGTPYHQARIGSREDTNYADMRFNELLGLRTKAITSDYYGKVRDWIKWAKDLGGSVEVTRDPSDAAVMRVKVEEQAGFSRTLSLDASRDFMISGYESVLVTGSVSHTAVFKVTDAEPVSGTWVPKRAVRRVGRSDVPDTYQEKIYQAGNFRIGALTDRDLYVDFPAGSEVVDDVQKIAYFINGDGTYRLLPLGIPETGELRVPLDPPTTNRVGVSAGNLYRTGPPEMAGAVPPAAPPKPWLRRAALSAASVLLIAGVATAIIRRRVAKR
jgi:hypothetical protein